MIMKEILLKGCGTALITPFLNGEVDYDAFAALVDRQVAGGVDFLVPLGTTGETPCLTNDEKVRVLQIAKEHSNGLPVMAGVGTNCPEQTIANIKLLEPHGVDFFLVVVPYYNKPPQEGIYQYYKRIAESTSKPIVLYNVPGRTGVNMTAETTLRLAEIENIVAVKEASSNRDQILEILAKRPEGFVVLSGNDDETFDLMDNGAEGVISVASNIVPQMVADLTHNMLAKQRDEAKQLHDRLLPLFKNCFVESNPIPTKTALASMGLIADECRLPLVSAKKETSELMKKTIAELV